MCPPRRLARRAPRTRRRARDPACPRRAGALRRGALARTPGALRAGPGVCSRRHLADLRPERRLELGRQALRTAVVGVVVSGGPLEHRFGVSSRKVSLQVAQWYSAIIGSSSEPWRRGGASSPDVTPGRSGPRGPVFIDEPETAFPSAPRATAQETDRSRIGRHEGGALATTLGARRRPRLVRLQARRDDLRRRRHLRGRRGTPGSLNGQIPVVLGQVAPDLLATAPDIRTVDVIAVK